MRTCALLLLFAVLPAVAADSLTGTWSGTMTLSVTGAPGDPDGQPAEVPAVLVLRQEGSTLTGSLAPAGRDPVPIEHGAVADKITFEINQGGTVKFSGTLSGGALRIQFEGTVQGGGEEHTLKGSLDLKRKE